jgi:hypothetical protein
MGRFSEAEATVISIQTKENRRGKSAWGDIVATAISRGPGRIKLHPNPGKRLAVGAGVDALAC